VVRPHPVAVAGTPTAFAYDAATRVLDFSWSATRATGTGRFPPGAVTSISTPALDYPDGYSVSATGAKVTSAPCAATLTLTRRPGAGPPAPPPACPRGRRCRSGSRGAAAAPDPFWPRDRGP